jgi:self-protective colicin-like immunity protein
MSDADPSHEDAAVVRMLANYRDLIRRFIRGDIEADEFETNYVARFKDDPSQVTGEEFNILDGLFADVDDYVSDPALRESIGGITGGELRTRAHRAYVRLFEDRE